MHTDQCRSANRFAESGDYDCVCPKPPVVEPKPPTNDGQLNELNDIVSKGAALFKSILAAPGELNAPWDEVDAWLKHPAVQAAIKASVVPYYPPVTDAEIACLTTGAAELCSPTRYAALMHVLARLAYLETKVPVLASMKDIIRYSWRPIDYQYDSLTGAERARISRDQFDAIIAELEIVDE